MSLTSNNIVHPKQVQFEKEKIAFFFFLFICFLFQNKIKNELSRFYFLFGIENWKVSLATMNSCGKIRTFLKIKWRKVLFLFSFVQCHRRASQQPPRLFLHSPALKLNWPHKGWPLWRWLTFFLFVKFLFFNLLTETRQVQESRARFS